MKTRYLAAVVLLPVALTLSACGQSPDPEKPGLSTSTTIEDVVVAPTTPPADTTQQADAKKEVSKRFDYTPPTKTGKVSRDEFDKAIANAYGTSTYVATPRNVDLKVTQKGYGVVIENDAYIRDDGAMYVTITVPEEIQKELLKQAGNKKGVGVFPYLLCASPGSSTLVADNKVLACSAKKNADDKKWKTVTTVEAPKILGMEIRKDAYEEPTFISFLTLLESLYGPGTYTISVDGNTTTFTGKGAGWSYVNTLAPKKSTVVLDIPDGSGVTMTGVPAKRIQVNPEKFPF